MLEELLALLQKFNSKHEYPTIEQFMKYLKGDYFNTYETKDFSKRNNVKDFDVMDYEDKFIMQFGTFDAKQVEEIVNAYWYRVKKSGKAYLLFGDIIITIPLHKKMSTTSLYNLSFDEIRDLKFDFSFFKTRLDNSCFASLGTKFFHVTLKVIIEDLRRNKAECKACSSDKDLLLLPTFIALWGLFTISHDLNAEDRYNDYAVFANYLIFDQMERIINSQFVDYISTAKDKSSREIYRLIGILNGIKLFEAYKRAYLSSKKEKPNPLTVLKVDSMESDILKVFNNEISACEYAKKYESKGSILNILVRYAEVDL